MEQRPEPRFPFTAIVGQVAMKRALLFNAVNPKIGGVLIRGKKGTAKSTAVRSLAALLPQVRVVQGCPYSCAPEAPQGLCQRCQPGEDSAQGSARQVRIVDLPVGATEDRLVGSLDIEQAIKTGTRAFEPGLIAATHQGILYIDEVNLLNDHLVDVLLDASAMGRNYVEREGISVSHAAEFLLVGTMNPEEGDLRPQLLDRFGLAVEVDGTFSPEERQEVVRRRIDYERDPHQFMTLWLEEEERERLRLSRSRELLPRVEVSASTLDLISRICTEYQVDGMRADIVMYKTAGTIAAYEGRDQATADDVKEAGLLALLHRQRRQPFQQPQLATEQLDSMVQDFQDRQRSREPSAQENGGPQESSQNSDEVDPYDSPEDPTGSPPDEQDAGPSGSPDQEFEVGESFPVPFIDVEPPDKRPRRGSGSRSKSVGDSQSGRYVGARIPRGEMSDLALDATLRAAAPRQQTRRDAVTKSLPDPLHPEGTEGAVTSVLPSAPPGLPPVLPAVLPAVLIEPWDVREKVRETKTGNLVLFVVDASGSMAAQRRMVAVKGAVRSLLIDAYQRRDRVGLISFRGAGAEVLLPPTGSVELAEIHLAQMPTGGRTPLGQGLYLALQVIEMERAKNREVLPFVVLLSDGRANVPLQGPERPAQSASGEAAGAANPASADARQIASLFRELRIPSVVVDTEVGILKFGLAQPVAEALGAQYIKLDDLRADNLAQAVRLRLPRAN